MTDKLDSGKSWKTGGLATVILLMILFYTVSQPRISFMDGQPYDAESYVQLANQAAAGEPFSTLSPFAYRIGLPWLVGTFFADDPLTGFRLINLVFGCLTLLLLHRFLRHYLTSNTVILLLILLYVVNPNSPFRLVHFYPATTDPPALFLVLLILHLSNKFKAIKLRQSLLLMGLGIVGVIFREIVLSAVMVVAFCHSFELRSGWPLVRIRSVGQVSLALLPLLATVVTLVTLNRQIEGLGGYSYWIQVQETLRHLFDNASIYPLAWLMAFGVPLIMILLTLNRQLLQYLIQHQELLVFLAGMMLLGMIGGYHTDRFAYWAYPAIFVLFGRFLETHPICRRVTLPGLLLLVPAVLIQLLVHRVLLPLPDDTNGALLDPGSSEFLLFAPFGSSTNLAHIFAAYMEPAARMTLLLQFFGIIFYFGLVLFVAATKAGQGQSTTPGQKLKLD